MDPESLKREREKERAKIKEEVLAELKEQYYLKPKSEKLEISDILEPYKEMFLMRVNNHTYSQWESIKSAIRKSVCLHFGARQMKDIPKDMYEEFRKEVKRFIEEYLLK